MQVHVDVRCCVRLSLCMKRHAGMWRSCLVFWSGLTLLRPTILALVIDESVIRTVVCGRRGILFQNWSLERETLIMRISEDWNIDAAEDRQTMPLLSYKLGFFLATGENHENVQEGITIFFT